MGWGARRWSQGGEAPCHHGALRLRADPADGFVRWFAVAVGRYEDVNAFLSPPMTVRSLVLSTGVDLCAARTPCRLLLSLRTIEDWYPASLEEISLNLWRGVEPVDAELVRLVQMLPKLRIFDFRGPVTRLDCVERLLDEALNRHQNLSYLTLALQERITVQPIVNFRQEVASLERKYLQPYKEKNIHLQLIVYKL
ncbi:uncharacterized protein LOC127751244 [Frankliniella occidentalis]|uniref:Uncharacterized protein LOC127751244 n=1 Tax=Frankliniella occidentalis TaxID=133901 RepID=A0A9C6X7C0_FRAOC|nr:uncharacterized protein LOC127751244 [Frankliniella occidentalis]